MAHATTVYHAESGISRRLDQSIPGRRQSPQTRLCSAQDAKINKSVLPSDEALRLEGRINGHSFSPWNFSDPIIQAARRFLEGGGKFVIPLPNLELFEILRP